jgi:hypothetical protein
MTSVPLYDPQAPELVDGELPPLPMGALAVGLAELLRAAADLPQPRYINLSSGQFISLQFAPDRSSFDALTGWALRFGGVVASEPREDGEIGCHLEFAYQGVTVGAYAYIPAAQPAT